MLWSQPQEIPVCQIKSLSSYSAADMHSEGERPKASASGAQVHPIMKTFVC